MQIFNKHYPYLFNVKILSNFFITIFFIDIIVENKVLLSASEFLVSNKTLKSDQLASSPESALLKYVDEIAKIKDEKLAIEKFKQLVSFGSATISGLVKITQNNKLDMQVRWVAAQALGVLGGDLSLSALIKLLSDSDPMMRIAGARALGELKDIRATNSLIKVFEKESAAVVKVAIIDAFSSMKSSNALDFLFRELHDEKKFEGKNSFVRVHCVNAITNIAGQGAIRDLIDIADDFDNDVRLAVQQALMRLSNQTTPPPAKKTEKERWVDFFSKPNLKNGAIIIK